MGKRARSPDAILADLKAGKSDALVARSPVLKHLVEAGKVKIVAAVYDLETGKVDWAN